VPIEIVPEFEAKLLDLWARCVTAGLVILKPLLGGLSGAPYIDIREVSVAPSPRAIGEFDYIDPESPRGRGQLRPWEVAAERSCFIRRRILGM
jgi:hypothetical protein